MRDRVSIPGGVTAGAAAQTLVLEIHPDDLVRIRGAQLRIVVARSARAEQPVLVWHSLEPFQINTVTWQEGVYGLYASTVDVAPGAQVIMVALLPDAQAGYYYAFTASAVFAGPYWDSRVPPDAYGVQNAMPAGSYPQLTFGLGQKAVLNGVAVGDKPVSARSVLASRLVTFAPVPTVYVWLEGGVASSMVIERVGADAARVDYAGGATQTLIYDPDLGRFVLKPAAGGIDQGGDSI